jgi:hypothetical protein
MLSSTISELATLRKQVGERVEKANLATAWRFEEHAVAAGAPPDEQYLGIAASCDLYVLIIASQQSDATQAEYHEAYRDNPEKVLPFFLGNGSASVTGFRAVIDSRHTRVSRPSIAELVEPITEAILATISTGKVVRPLLLADVDRRIERARTAIANVPLVLEPRIVANGADYPAADVIGSGRRVALAGIGGSGKTMTAAITARRAASDGRTLPVYVAPSEGTTEPMELIRQRLEAARFLASDDLLERWGAEGRVMLVVDSVEGLTAIARRRLMGGITRWAERFPRCSVVVTARRFSALELPEFVRVEAAPLSEAQMRDLTQAIGLAGRPLRFSAQVRDIGRWPMWATALLVYGTEARTGLELLQRLVDARLHTAGMSSPVEAEELRAAARFVASDQWPAMASGVPETLERIRRWHEEPAAAAKFPPRPAADVLLRLGEAALLEVGDDAAFPHRLMATILAAEYAVEETGRALSADQELAPFVAALADDDAHADLLRRLLGAHDIFVLARYLRLSPPQHRTIDLDADVRRLAAANRLWSSTGGELDVVFGDTWIATRPADVFRVDRCENEGFAEWRSKTDQPIELWSPLPFEEHSPEFIAAVQVLSRFRSQVLALDPGGDPTRKMSPNRVQALTSNRVELSTEVVEALRRQRQAHYELLDSLGMREAAGLRPPEGEPRATIWTPQQAEPLVHIVWEGDRPSVDLVPSAPAPVQGSTGSLARLLGADPRAAAYEAMKRDIEAELGCRLGARTWSRPELVPAWAW